MGETVMLDRIAAGRTDLVFEYLSAGHPATTRDADGVSLLAWCAYYGDVAAIRLLLSKGETPLHAALCTANRLAHDLVLRVLLAAGTDPNRATRPNAETGSFMRDCRTKGETPLHRAAAFGQEETVRLLLEAGAAVDAKDMNGDSPLSWASWHLRPVPVLRRLCYGGFSIRPDYGAGMAANLLGRPLGPTGRRP